MKAQNDYNEIKKSTPPIFSDYVAEVVLEGDDNFTNVSHFIFQDDSGKIAEVYVDE